MGEEWSENWERWDGLLHAGTALAPAAAAPMRITQAVDRVFVGPALAPAAAAASGESRGYPLTSQSMPAAKMAGSEL
jgi:hypothetical protein